MRIMDYCSLLLLAVLLLVWVTLLASVGCGFLAVALLAIGLLIVLFIALILRLALVAAILLLVVGVRHRG